MLELQKIFRKFNQFDKAYYNAKIINFGSRL